MVYAWPPFKVVKKNTVGRVWVCVWFSNRGGLARGFTSWRPSVVDPKTSFERVRFLSCTLDTKYCWGFFVLLLKICFGSRGSLVIGCVYIIYNWLRYFLFGINSVKFKRNNYLACKGDCAFSFSESSIISNTVS